MRVDGFLGLEVFEKYVVRHDYLEKELTFYRPENFSDSGGGQSIPFERVGNILVRSGFLDIYPTPALAIVLHRGCSTLCLIGYSVSPRGIPRSDGSASLEKG